MHIKRIINQVSVIECSLNANYKLFLSFPTSAFCGIVAVGAINVIRSVFYNVKLLNSIQAQDKPTSNNALQFHLPLIHTDFSLSDGWKRTTHTDDYSCSCQCHDQHQQQDV